MGKSVGTYMTFCRNVLKNIKHENDSHGEYNLYYLISDQGDFVFLQKIGKILLDEEVSQLVNGTIMDYHLLSGSAVDEFFYRTKFKKDEVKYIDRLS